MREDDERDPGDNRIASLQALVSEMEASLPELRAQRSSVPFANDIFEAVDDWRSACRYVLHGDTKVNYKARAFSERHLISVLSNRLQTMSVEDQHKYAAYLEMGSKTIAALEATKFLPDGHLSVLRIIRDQFLFVQGQYGFSSIRLEPIGLCFFNGTVFLDLKWGVSSSMSCSFGLDSDLPKSFWIEDLLYACKDLRYQEIPDRLDLQTEADTERWFSFLAELIKQHGHDFLTNTPGIWEKLRQAQFARDAEIEAKNLGE